MNAIERFMSQVQPEPMSGCWLWDGADRGKGYGSFWLGRGMLAHRAAWLLFKGETRGLCVLHKCDVRCCVNPDHLFLGTHAENNADRDSKGRHTPLRGEKHGCAKLTEGDVLAIKADPRSQRAIARAFGVSATAVGYILRGKSWSYLNG